MFIKILVGCVSVKKPRAVGDIVECEDVEGQFLINIKKAELAVEPKAKPKKKTKSKE